MTFEEFKKSMKIILPSSGEIMGFSVTPQTDHFRAYADGKVFIEGLVDGGYYVQIEQCGMVTPINNLRDMERALYEWANGEVFPFCLPVISADLSDSELIEKYDEFLRITGLSAGLSADEQDLEKIVSWGVAWDPVFKWLIHYIDLKTATQEVSDQVSELVMIAERARVALHQFRDACSLNEKLFAEYGDQVTPKEATRLRERAQLCLDTFTLMFPKP